LHYTDNNAPISTDPHDYILVDAGCEYLGYASDITRTWPCGGLKGKDGKGRIIYEIVLKAQEVKKMFSLVFLFFFFWVILSLYKIPRFLFLYFISIQLL